MRIRIAHFLSQFAVFGFLDGKTLTWKFDSDISNKENWIDGKLAVNCKGLHFAPENEGLIIIRQLTTAEVTLPYDGEITFVNQGFIEFKDNKKCIKLKPLTYHEWDDPASWTPYEDNAAIPDKERIPCDHDDVIFPKIDDSRVSPGMMGRGPEVSSLKVGDRNVARFDFTRGGEGFYVTTSDQDCEDPNGCLCHSGFVRCNVKEKYKVKCKQPVVPEESCHEICGGYITYEIKRGPQLYKVELKLKDYSVDTHVSRVINYFGQEAIQVVFSEKEYTGKSLEELEDFHTYLKSTLGENLQMFKSGQFFEEDGGSAIGIIFGSLAAVAIFFAIVIYLHSSKSNALGVMITSFNNRARGSVFNMPFFARFDNTDENLIIDGSDSGSILDIAKSFDNPMYGQSAPATSATTEHENPLYDVKESQDEDEEVEE